MERKLASIKKIRKLMPIKGADFIELAMVDDWTCIVKKGEFIEGRFCVFFEIDSLLGDEPRYEFLASSKRDYFGTPKYRIKTMKMKGVISQGLALPLSTFPEIHLGFNLGDDVTELLKIIKYDPEFYDNKPGSGPKAGNAQGKFPSFIPKTDQERIQNLPHYYEMYQNHLWEETLKLDGSSLTAYKISKPLSVWSKFKNWFGIKTPDYHFGVCSRNLELKSNDSFSKTFLNGDKPSEYNQSDFWKIMIQLEVEKYLPEGYAIQGELIGPKIQANHEKVSENQFYVFDIYDIKANRYLMPDERLLFFATAFAGSDIRHVPVAMNVCNIFGMCTNLELLQKRVTGESFMPGTVSEGRVYKSCTIPGLSFKCISNQYLLKNEK
jgi:RNA ligase (TIGR02306 family)